MMEGLLERLEAFLGYLAERILINKWPIINKTSLQHCCYHNEE